jgi:hypothetical protein
MKKVPRRLSKAAVRLLARACADCQSAEASETAAMGETAVK